ncbi:HlyD family efflux transporter periplasmic adaptor subunit [Kaarinaea lacus]
MDNPNNSNNDVSIRFDRASQRRHHRLTVPLGVKIQNHTYIALDWSTAGLRLRPYALKGKLKVDDEITLALSVPFHDFNVSLKLDAKVVRIDEESSDVAFAFIDPPQRATELLRYFADQLIRGEMASIEGTIKRMDLPVTPPAPKPPPKTSNGNGKNTQAARSLFIGFGYLTVGFVVAISLYYTLYTNVFLVTSDQAFVYTPSVDVIVPEGGEVSAVYVREGDQVSEGEPLLKLNSQRLDHLLSEAQFEVRSALNERRRLEASIKSEQETLTTYRQIASDQVAAAEARLSSAKTQQSLLERQFDRVSTMSQQGKQGLVSTEELDRIQTDQLRASQAVSEAQAELRIARSAYAAAQKGAYYSSNRLESRLPTLQNDLASANDRIELAESRLHELQKQAIRLVIRAPVSGRIRQVTVPSGGTVMAGTQAVSLLTDQTLQVYTKIPSHELGRIAVGDSASVYVPVLSRNLDARVVAIEPRLWSLPNNVRRLLGEPSDGGLVVLNFDLLADTGMALLNPGLPVTVQLKNNSVRSVVRRVAKLFQFSDTNATAVVPVHERVTLAK